MRNDTISFETAKLTKEKGFNEHTLDFYDEKGNERGDCNWYSSVNYNNGEGYIKCSAPEQPVLRKWLREKYNEHISITYMAYDNTYSGSLTMRSMGWSGFKTHEEALEKCLQVALKVIKTNI